MLDLSIRCLFEAASSVSAREIGRKAGLVPRRTVSRYTHPMSGRRIPVDDQQIRETQQQRNPLRVLREAPVAHLAVAEMPLHIQERMLHLRLHRPLAALRLLKKLLPARPSLLQVVLQLRKTRALHRSTLIERKHEVLSHNRTSEVCVQDRQQ